MDTIKAMTAFARVVELGGFSAAARALNTTQSNVSKLISALERELGGSLLERGARTPLLTEAGERYLAQIGPILQAVRDARDAFSSQRQFIGGSVRIAASWAFGRTQIIPALPGLMEQHPRIHVDLHLSDQNVDMLREGIDVAFRVAKLRDSSLIARYIGMTRRFTVASPDYLARRGRPQHPDDLKSHECIHFAGIGGSRTWRLQHDGRNYDVPVQGRFQANASEGLHEAALHGLGVALLPEWMVQEDIAAGRVSVVLPEYQPHPLPIYAVMLRSSRDAFKNKAVVDYFVERFSASFGLIKPSRRS